MEIQIAAWAGSPWGITVITIITVAPLIAAFRKKILALLIRIIGPFFRSLTKEPQRLASTIHIDYDSMDRDGLCLIGRLERKTSDPIIYPEIKMVALNTSFDFSETQIMPMVGNVLTYHITSIGYGNLDQISEKSEVTVTVKCFDDLVPAKVNIPVMKLKFVIELHKAKALEELKNLCQSLDGLDSTEDESFDSLRGRLVKRHPNWDDTNVPNDVFRLLLDTREAAKKMVTFNG